MTSVFRLISSLNYLSSFLFICVCVCMHVMAYPKGYIKVKGPVHYTMKEPEHVPEARKLMHKYQKGEP